eukprot:scaffold180492_cov33-Cyclotella_meneghiniana.AAC.1
MGRWRGETFLEYILESLSDFSEGMSSAMNKCFGFVSLESGCYNDVTNLVVGAEYNVPMRSSNFLLFLPYVGGEEKNWSGLG